MRFFYFTLELTGDMILRRYTVTVAAESFAGAVILAKKEAKAGGVKCVVIFCKEISHDEYLYLNENLLGARHE